MTEVWALGLIFTAMIIGGFGSIYLKKGANKMKLSLEGTIKNKTLATGISLYIISSVFYTISLRGGHLSILYPLVSLSYVFICFLSIKMLAERMNRWKWMGIACILVGVTLIGLGS
ncbi:EamA family transporter [Candidatus Altiarchaeota archaeon]